MALRMSMFRRAKEVFPLFRYDVVEELRRSHAASTQSPLGDLFVFGPIAEVTTKVGNEAEIINGQAVSGVTADCECNRV